MRKDSIVAFLLILLAARAPSALAQGGDSTRTTIRGSTTLAPHRGRLLGIFDENTGEPIEGVEVRDIATGLSAQTTRTGTMSLIFLPDGGSIVQIRKVGYEARLLPIAISRADTAPITMTLTRVQQLSPVLVHDTSDGGLSRATRAFDEHRRNATSGYFITGDVLRKEEARPLANVLRAHAPSVEIRATGPFTYLMRSPRCSGGGPPDVYVDGVPIGRIPTTPNGPTKQRTTESVPPIDLSQFSVSSLAGVEYYPDNAGLPIEVPHTSVGCGALLLWTR